MLKNRFAAAFAAALMLGAAACGDAAEEPVVEEAVETTPAVIDAEAEPIAPEVMEGAIMMDTSAVGTMVDTTTM